MSGTSSAAAAAASSPVDEGSKRVGADGIAAILKATGPVVKCVLLQHMDPTGRDAKPHPVVGQELKAVETEILAELKAKKNHVASEHNDHATTSPIHIPTSNHREILIELIKEIQIDTTPGKYAVQGVLGGSFTFLGQYPDEGVVLMARADQFADLTEIENLSVKELSALMKDNPDIAPDNTLLEKSDLIQAVKEAQLPLNPHKLQPPFDDFAVRGDILIMRVSDTTEEEDESNDDNPENALAKAVNEFTNATAVSNDEFFLNYTKEEYVTFATRTDVVAPIYEATSDDDDEDVNDENDDNDETQDDNDVDGDGDEENDENFNADDATGEDNDDERRLLLNLILGEVIKSFRNENQRGPDSAELLELRSQVAEKLGLDLPPSTPPVTDGKRASGVALSNTVSPKRVKFSSEMGEESIAEEVDEDKKMPAKPKTRTDNSEVTVTSSENGGGANVKQSQSESNT